jgi:hypothetical protein
MEVDSMARDSFLDLRRRIAQTILTVAVAQPGFSAVASADFLAETYYPIPPGRSWEYLEDGVDLSTETVLAGTQLVGGVETRVIQTTGGVGDGFFANQTNDGLGLRLHREFDSELSISYSPPIGLLLPVFELDVPLVTQGIATIPTVGTFAVTTTTVVSGPVPITVPFGTFQALVLESRISLAGISETDRHYMVEHIGPVRIVYDVLGELGPPIIADLLSLTVPEPGLLQGLVPSLAIIAYLARRKAT